MGLKEEISRLKREMNAVILVHNYQRPEVQDMADFLGDSLDLCQKATELDADYIVFCGVRFMAETAAILNPDKKILMPDETATCPLANMLTKKVLLEAKRKNPGAPVVLYINTNADAKAEADIICTSANAPAVVNSLPQNTVLFGPDKNMCYYLSKRSKKNIIPVPADGYCPVHRDLIQKIDILLLKREHPNAILLAHPECNQDVQEMADYVLGTGGMVKKAKELPNKEFIIATEEGICHRLKKENPAKEFYPIKKAVCPNMKKGSLEKIRDALKSRRPVITVQEDVAERARKAIERMLEVKQ